MTTAIAPATKAEAVESALLQGDLSRLSPEERTRYYLRVCDSLGLNPLTKPFEYLTLQGKTILYARRDCAEQLRKRDEVSTKIVSRDFTEGVYVVTVQATLPNGRIDESVGAVTIEGLKGEARANAMMKAETKAKRRVTLSICGLGMLDESEVSDIPGVRVAQPSEEEQPRQLPPVNTQGNHDAFAAALGSAATLDALAKVWGDAQAARNQQQLTREQFAALGQVKDTRKTALQQPASPSPAPPPPPPPVAASRELAIDDGAEFAALLDEKGMMWMTAMGQLNIRYRTAYTGRTAWTDIPEDQRTWLVGELLKLPSVPGKE